MAVRYRTDSAGNLASIYSLRDPADVFPGGRGFAGLRAEMRSHVVAKADAGLGGESRWNRVTL